MDNNDDITITEFTDLDPEELHLVGTPANKFAPLMAKSKQKGSKMRKKLTKALRNAGADPTMALEIAETILRAPSESRGGGARHLATGAGRGIDLSGGASRVNAPAVFKALDAEVDAARQSLAKAGDEFAEMRAREQLRTVLKRRATAKLIAADNGRQNGTLPRGRFGPNSAQLFTNTHSIGEDSGIKYLGSRQDR